MKQFSSCLSLSLLALLFGGQPLHAAVLAEFSITTNTVEPTKSATFIATNISSPITASYGSAFTNQAVSNLPDTWSFNHLNAAADLDEAATTGNQYIEFTIAPDSGYQLSIDSFSFTFRNRDAIDYSFGLYSSLDSYSTSLGSSTLVSPASTSYNTITFTSLGLLNQTSPVTLRLAIDATADYKIGGFADNATTGTDKAFQINGTVAAVPEPGTYAMLALAALALGSAAFMRRK